MMQQLCSLSTKSDYLGKCQMEQRSRRLMGLVKLGMPEKMRKDCGLRMEGVREFIPIHPHRPSELNPLSAAKVTFRHLPRR